jgi:hypothetical protein
MGVRFGEQDTSGKEGWWVCAWDWKKFLKRNKDARGRECEKDE